MQALFAFAGRHRLATLIAAGSLLVAAAGPVTAHHSAAGPDGSPTAPTTGTLDSNSEEVDGSEAGDVETGDDVPIGETSSDAPDGDANDQGVEEPDGEANDAEDASDDDSADTEEAGNDDSADTEEAGDDDSADSSDQAKDDSSDD